SFIVSPAVSLSRIRHELPSVRGPKFRMCQDELLPSHSGGPDDRPPLLNIALLGRAPSASGVCCSREGSSCPCSASRVRTAGSAKASTTAALSLSMTIFGVPLGEKSAYQFDM